MVWYIPTTWFEDLGAAKRISPFTERCTGEDYDHAGNQYFSMVCHVRLPSGEVVLECTEPRSIMPSFSLFSGQIPYYIKQPWIAELEGQIRGKYPREATAPADR